MTERILTFIKLHVWNVTNTPAIIALVLTICFWQYTEYQSGAIQEHSLREEVIGNASVLQSRLEGKINSNLQLVRGVVSVLSARPNTTQPEFESLLSDLFGDHSELTIVAGAPNLVISMIYPISGNEQAIGLDYNQNPAQFEAALRARDSGKLILAGPIDLVQGGQGFIGRYPVFIRSSDGSRRFWGIVSAVIDVQKLYENSGLLDESMPVEVSLVSNEKPGQAGQAGRVFFGPDIRDDPRSVVLNVALPSGSWKMLAQPRGGWDAYEPDLFSVRMIMFLAGILIFIPSAYSGHLMRQRALKNKELAEREQKIGLISERLNIALASSNVGVWEANLTTGERYWDKRTTLLFGWESEGATVPADAFTEALHTDDLERVMSSFGKAIDEKSQLNTEFRIVLPDGTTRHLQSRCAYYHPYGSDPKMVGVNWDITEDVKMRDELLSSKRLAESKNVELQQMQKRIEYIALHDALTDLPNRRFLDQTIEQFAKSAHKSDPVAMLVVDLDRFKQINDTLGHLAGDATLKHVAQVLLQSVDERDFVARIGGDEFVVMVKRPFDKAELATLAEGIIEALKEPVMYEGQPCRFGASMGIAHAKAGSSNLNDLMVQSDIALYRAKECGRNCFEFFSNEQQERIVKAREVAEEILWGLELGQFVPFYQPQFDANTCEVIGVEALARWDHPDKGILGPFEFLKVAEDISVVDEIDHEILTAVLNDFKYWDEQGVHVEKASVNISSPRLRDDNLVRRLRELDIEPGRITFELLESIFLDESDNVIDKNLAQIKAMGIDIDIDDFGTGHASIVGLLNLQPNRIKIDRQFVSSIAEAVDQRRLVKSMIDMGKSLGIRVLAEGVETQEQADILRELGVDELQGYLYAKPMAAPDLRHFLSKYTWSKSKSNCTG
ncbi:bifunctional diguanylate cyclase/phosphodiesterase [Maritalea sp.]|uniref:bifunctional diguanylate cyclase/phosphodiesterase n=1 Tax=Maritalea sp. TaxID=2003361 RepID=UPI003EFA8652